MRSVDLACLGRDSDGGWPARPEDLTHHACLLYSYQSEPGVWVLRGPEGERRVRVSGRLRANNGEALREAAIAGFGLERLADVSRFQRRSAQPAGADLVETYARVP